MPHPSSLFIIGYVLTALIFLAVGLCLLISPATYFDLLDRLARVNLWANPSPSWNPNAPRWRALGVGFTLFAIFMVFGPPLFVYFGAAGDHYKHFHASGSDLSWTALVILALISALGLGFLAKPLAMLDRVSARKLSAEPGALQHAYKIRILGAALLLVSLLGICVQLLRRFTH